MSNCNKIFKVNLKFKNIRRKVKVFDEVESTNLLMLNDPKCKNGSVVWAKIQTKGKGRLNRSWISKQGGLWFSVCFILKNKIKKNADNPNFSTHVQTLTSGINLSSALAVVKALEKLGIQDCKIKWPNDVFMSGKQASFLDLHPERSNENFKMQERGLKSKNLTESGKICGILTQTIFEKNMTKIVLGIGLNVNQNSEDFPDELRNKASSLKILTTKTYELEEILTQILNQLDTCITQIIEDNSLTSIITELNTKSILKGKTVKIKLSTEIITGKVLGISEDGGIIIEKSISDGHANQNIVTLYAGEIIEIL